MNLTKYAAGTVGVSILVGIPAVTGLFLAVAMGAPIPWWTTIIGGISIGVMGSVILMWMILLIWTIGWVLWMAARPFIQFATN